MASHFAIVILMVCLLAVNFTTAVTDSSVSSLVSLIGKVSQSIVMITLDGRIFQVDQDQLEPEGRLQLDGASVSRWADTCGGLDSTEDMPEHMMTVLNYTITAQYEYYLLYSLRNSSLAACHLSSVMNVQVRLHAASSTDCFNCDNATDGIYCAQCLLNATSLANTPMKCATCTSALSVGSNCSLCSADIDCTGCLEGVDNISCVTCLQSVNTFHCSDCVLKVSNRSGTHQGVNFSGNSLIAKERRTVVTRWSTPPMAWVSSVDMMAFYMIWSDDLHSRVSIGKAFVHWSDQKPGHMEDKLYYISENYSVCRQSELPDSEIYMNREKCARPVNWDISSGYADHQRFYLLSNIQRKVYLFDKVLFTYADTNTYGQLEVLSYEQFFGGTQKSHDWNLTLVIIAILVVFILIGFTFLLWIYLRKPKSSGGIAFKGKSKQLDDKEKDANGEKTSGRKKVLKDKPNKKASWQGKRGSALLPDINPSQAVSLKTEPEQAKSNQNKDISQKADPLHKKNDMSHKKGFSQRKDASQKKSSKKKENSQNKKDLSSKGKTSFAKAKVLGKSSDKSKSKSAKKPISVKQYEVTKKNK